MFRNNWKRHDDQVIHTKVARFQAEAERVCQIGIYDPDLEHFQREVRSIILTYTTDLQIGNDPEFALKIARMDLQTVKWRMQGKIRR